MTDEEEVPIATGTLMRGKRGLIMGVANDKSLAWGISRQLYAQGAELGFTFQGEALEKRVRPLAASVGSSKLVVPCDVTDTASMDAVFEEVRKANGASLISSSTPSLFPTRTKCKGKYIDTTRSAILP